MVGCYTLESFQGQVPRCLGRGLQAKKATDYTDDTANMAPDDTVDPELSGSA
jgi:hypothetical protein